MANAPMTALTQAIRAARRLAMAVMLAVVQGRPSPRLTIMMTMMPPQYARESTGTTIAAHGLG